MLKSAKLLVKTVQHSERTVPPLLKHGLDRYLFQKGAHLLTNDDYKLLPKDFKHLPKVSDFRLSSLSEYKSASKDMALLDQAVLQGYKFCSSTSSMTSLMTKMYYLVSGMRKISKDRIPESFKSLTNEFTAFSKGPVYCILKHYNGTYAIDKPSEEEKIILMDMGKLLEKLLTTDPQDFEQYKLSSTSVPQDGPEAYHYAQIGNFLLRAQLDCYHPDLPKKTFDLKTRATHPIRMDVMHYEEHVGYKIKQQTGKWFSFEREYYDLLRSGLLKYNFQARIGNMDGVLLCYHNLETIFGFEYVSLEKMDQDLFTSTLFAEHSFQLSCQLLEKTFEHVIQNHPTRDIHILFAQTLNNHLHLFVSERPFEGEISPSDIEQYEIKIKSKVNGNVVQQPMIESEQDEWMLEYSIEQIDLDHERLQRTLSNVVFRSQTRMRNTRYMKQMKKELEY
ncbi:mitochondrial protein Pet127-domain-containing protein [Gorgonomyces haynaldii]|nr:mitochondrial protein Pet127-domain-containing protein [Gorgonomyces haynaldii]